MLYSWDTMQTVELFLLGDQVVGRQSDGTTFVPSANDIYSFKFESLDSIHGLAPVVENRDVANLSFSRFPLELRLKLQRDSRGVLVCSWVGIHEGAEYALPNLRNRAADHIVIDKVWMPLAKDSVSAIRAIETKFGFECPGNISLRQYLGLMAHPDRATFLIDASGQSEGIGLQTARGALDAVPRSFVGTLYDYQVNGYHWLRSICSEDLGCLLADEMGLGKTAQVIALFAREKELNPGRPSLVIAPATILENWKRELSKFAPALVVLVHRGNLRTGLPSELKKHDVVVTSYETAVRDLPLFKMVNWGIVTLDEAQAIKNPETRRAIAIKKLPRRVGIAVTGTPVENRLADLWSIMDFALPGYLGSLEKFQHQFEGSIERASQLEPFVTPLLLRRRIGDVAMDLPERIEIPQALELSDDGAMEYEKIRRETLEKYGAAASLVALTKLRMFCSHRFLINGVSGDPVDDSPKYQRLVEVLEEIFANEEKALVFTSFNEMTDVIIQDVRSRFATYVDFIDGRVPANERQKKVDWFGSHAGAGMLVLNPRTGGTGLNITAANHVLHYTLEWNPAVEDQASARSYRRGQTKPVTIHRFFYVNTVEDVINDRLTSKRDLAAAAVVGTSGGEMEKDDLLRALKKSPIQ